MTYCPPMLASDIKNRLEVLPKIISNPTHWIYEFKIDGVRMLTTYYDGHLICYTRNGLGYPNVAKYLETQFENISAFDGWIIDGEVYDTNVRKTMSRISNMQQPVTKLQYYLFDMFPISHCLKQYNVPLVQRKRMLQELLLKSHRSKYILYVPHRRLRIDNPDKLKEEIFALADIYIQKGWEGLMLKHSKSPYQHTRSTLWWKVKKFQTLDLRCVDVLESTTNPGMLGAIVVDACGTLTSVGNGFTNKERILFWKHPKMIVGKIVEIRYFEQLPSGKLRFAVFVRIRNDKTEPDC